MYKPLKPVTQKTPHLMAPLIISPRGLVRENRALKYKVKQRKSCKFPYNHKLA